MDKGKKKKLFILGGTILAACVGHEFIEEFFGDVIPEEELAGLADADVVFSGMDAIDEPDIDVSDWEDDLEFSDEAGDESYAVSFTGRKPESIQTDINNCNYKLKSAEDNIEYYTKQLSRTDITNTYRGNCVAKLKDAAATYSETIRKLKSLAKELKDATKS